MINELSVNKKQIDESTNKLSEVNKKEWENIASLY